MHFDFYVSMDWLIVAAVVGWLMMAILLGRLMNWWSPVPPDLQVIFSLAVLIVWPLFIAFGLMIVFGYLLARMMNIRNE